MAARKVCTLPSMGGGEDMRLQGSSGNLQHCTVSTRTESWSSAAGRAECPSALRAAEHRGGASTVSKIEAAHDKGFSCKIQQCNL